jgi:hypothetical protein
MKTILHAVISVLVGGGLATITVVSALSTGITADTTVIAFTLLTVYGLIEVTLSDYAPGRSAGSHMALMLRPAKSPGDALLATGDNTKDAATGPRWHLRSPLGRKKSPRQASTGFPSAMTGSNSGIVRP